MSYQNDPRLNILDLRPISSWDYPKILVGIPIERSINYASKVFFPFLHIAMAGPAFAELPYGRTDFVRNQFGIQMLQTNFTHLLMLDVDHIHPMDIVQRFAANVITDPTLKVVSGWNYRRGKPFDPVSGMLDESGNRLMIDHWEPGLIEVDEVGCGSILIHRSVFETIEPPWFFNDYSKVWSNNWPGEDIGFSSKCREYGIPMFADTTITSPHCVETTVTETTFRNYQKIHENEDEPFRV